jgi:hypothetical protein
MPCSTWSPSTTYTTFAFTLLNSMYTYAAHEKDKTFTEDANQSKG